MEYIDLTLLIDEQYLEYPGDIPFSVSDELTFEKDKTNIKRINTNMHIGTHIDAKSHAIDSNETIDTININKLIGKAIVIEPKISNLLISTESIKEQYDNETRILILRTNQSKLVNTEFYYNYPKFERSFLDFIKETKINVLAIDFPSPNYLNEIHMEMHIDLLSKDITLIENLVNLDKLNKYVHFIALPLNLKGFDGSMTRCIAKNI